MESQVSRLSSIQHLVMVLELLLEFIDATVTTKVARRLHFRFQVNLPVALVESKSNANLPVELLPKTDHAGVRGEGKLVNPFRENGDVDSHCFSPCDHSTEINSFQTP